MNKNNIIERDFKQRAYDGKWEALARILDEENSYTYKSESGQVTTYTPEKWITIGVYDFMFTLTGELV